MAEPKNRRSHVEPPGVAALSGFTIRRRSGDTLSPEAKKRVDEKIAEVQRARRVALASSHSYVIGGADHV